jgi:hypothetical protein
VDSAKDIKDTSETTILEVTQPDGTVTKTTKTKKNVITTATKDVRTDSSRDAEKTTVKEFEAGWAVRLLVATRLNQSTLGYGVGVDHKIIGPITVGAWGLTDGTLGASIGLRF